MPAAEHELVNSRGDRVRLIDRGARIRSIELEIDGRMRDVVLGYGSLAQYASDRYYMGAIVGRCCNRIGGSRFSIGGVEYRLASNEGPNHLHGGPRGFSARRWLHVPGQDPQSADFTLVSDAGDQGYPGTLSVRASYSWSDDRELTLRWRATTDAVTPVNLTNHAYFNLDPDKHDVLRHDIRIASSRITPVGPDMIPTGEVADVTGTRLDLRDRTRVGRILGSDAPMVARAGGADFNYVLDDGMPAAELWSSNGDLRMSVETSCPGLQFYTGQHLGPPWRPCAGLCLEAQYFPDSPNQPGFPDTLLVPGREYDEYVRYRFTVN